MTVPNKTSPINASFTQALPLMPSGKLTIDKAAATVILIDFRKLKLLATHLGNRFVADIVLYDGETLTRFGSELYAVPIRARRKNR